MELVQFEFTVKKFTDAHIHSDFEFLYVLQGQIDLRLEEKSYTLGKGDFVVINADRKHSYRSEDDVLLASIHISYSELSRLLKQDMIIFWCNTATDDNEACAEIRTIVHRIVAEHYYTKQKDEIFLNSLYYEFLHVLTNDFLLNKNDSSYEVEAQKYSDRKHRIEDYIQQNYDKPISLNELADELFLSNAYLSKYIKKQFGMSFIDYLNSIRLNYAITQLLHTDKPVIRIAMDTGFASSTAMNKAFRDKYNLTPSEYRNQWKQKENKTLNTIEDEEKIQRQIAQFFLDNKEILPRDKKQPEETVTMTEPDMLPYEKNWCRMINMGAAADLLHSELQQHALYLKKQLHFTHVRFWDLYAEEMLLDKKRANGSFNFDKLNRVIDFLLANDLKPYIELRPKPKKIVKNSRDYILFNDEEPFVEKPEEFREFTKQLSIHLINRYTIEEVETWYFEVWKTELEKYLNETRIADKDASIGLYLDVFDSIAGTMRTYIPKARIGGGGFSLRWGETHFKKLLLEWKKRKNLPTFVSIYNYPYTVESISRSRTQSMDTSFIYKHTAKVRELMQETNFPVLELHCSEWNFSVSNRNVLNDHCMKGAYLVKNMIDCVGTVDLMGYWMGSDLYADYYDSNQLLNGCAGLISKDGLPKPAFFALAFMNHLGKYVRQKGDHCIITDNGAGNWRIVCHNLKQLNYEYGLHTEDEIRLEDQNNYFTNLKSNKMHFELPALRQGRYFLKMYSLNQKHGSLQDEWLEIANLHEIGPEFLEYLARIATPKLIVQNCHSENEKLTFDVVLEPNEILFIHCMYQFE